MDPSKRKVHDDIIPLFNSINDHTPFKTILSKGKKKKKNHIRMVIVPSGESDDTKLNY